MAPALVYVQHLATTVAKMDVKVAKVAVKMAVLQRVVVDVDKVVKAPVTECVNPIVSQGVLHLVKVFVEVLV